ncbi:hypothetical protein Tco_0799870 [Tanacetum coccineum]|uniref:DUF4283 domain-containing protein n=1 Tax=Tanacetum coccineum TaxID=301880 RepID=A0ABQ4ZUU5_9ASTR
MEGVDKPGSTILNSFVSLVINRATTCKVTFRSLDSDKPINTKAEIKIPKASILDVHLRYSFSLYGYFMGKRVAFSVVENYVKKAWKKFGLFLVMINLKGFYFFMSASIKGTNGVLENVPIWVNFHDIPIVAFTADRLNSWGRMDYARALIDIRARCGVCLVFEHDDMLCLKRLIEIPKKQHTKHDGFQYTSSSHCTNVISKVQFKPQKPIWQVVSKKNSASSSGTKKNSEVSKSSSNTHMVARINEQESQIIKGKLVLLDDDRKPLNPFTSTIHSSSNVVSKKDNDLVNEDNDTEAKDVY